VRLDVGVRLLWVNTLNLLKKYWAVLICVFVAIVYVFTLAPSVVQIDCGELAAVQSILGVSHPTGYPLFTIVGHLFSKIPLSSSKIFQLNLLSLIWCVLGIYFFLQSVRVAFPHLQGPKSIITTRRQKHRRSAKQSNSAAPKKGGAVYIDLIAAVAGGLFLAFCKTYWTQSTSVEVYSLHIFLINLVMYLSLKAFFQTSSSVMPWLMVAGAVAMGFANHLTTILFVPGIAYLFFLKHGFRLQALKRLGIMLAVFLPVLCAFYLYLPIRAGQDPVLNWGNTVNWRNFIYHLSGRQYRSWLLRPEVAGENLQRFFRNLPLEFWWVGLVAGLSGIFWGLIKATRLGIFLLITFVVTVLYSISYDIHDLDSYFLLAYIVYAFWIALAVWYILRFILRKRYQQVLLVCFLAGAIAFQASRNFSKVDQSDQYFYEDYTKRAIDSLPQNSILLTYQWDCLVSPAYYFQLVEEYRPDVVIIDTLLLKRSWYYNQLRTNYPEVMQKIEPQIKPFLKAVKPFERGGKFDSALLDKLYMQIIAQLIHTNTGERAVYIGQELFFEDPNHRERYLPEGLKLAPDLFFFRVVNSDEYVPLHSTNVDIRYPKHESDYVKNTKQFILELLIRRSLYELQHSKLQGVISHVAIIKKYFPDARLPASLKDF